MEVTMPDVRFALFDTTIGRCGVVWADSGIVAVQLPYPDEAQTRGRIRQRHTDLVEALPPARVQTAIDGMVTLLQGRPIDLSSVDLDLGDQPAFNREVYAITRGIPPGATLTYGAIAKRLGGVELSRSVGTALGQNPCPIVVPCHRVLAAGGKPGGFSGNGGVLTKLKMLAIEGAAVNHTPSLFD
ncbi:MAG: methylated-DNA--[protein]-cysteine S-methyltransferase [Tardiphaga sp.]|nr:methylated-DNA--[protein]-cysteine S-methyltransferase [Tardiphaga sp.]